MYVPLGVAAWFVGLVIWREMTKFLAVNSKTCLLRSIKDLAVDDSRRWAVGKVIPGLSG